MEPDHHAPYVRAEAREDMLVAKHGELFACTRLDGEMTGAPSEGLYSRDVRHLSVLCVRLGERAPVQLSATDTAAYEAVVDATNPELVDRDGTLVPQQSVSVRRRILIGDCMYLTVSLRNYSMRPVVTTLELALGADFADIFEVRGASAATERELRPPEPTSDGFRFAHRGADDVLRETRVTFDPPPSDTAVGSARARAAWPVRLAPRESLDLTARVQVSESACRGVAAARDAARRDHDEWTAECAAIETENEHVNAVLDASRRDLRALLTPLGDGELPAAGIPWYVSAFGRDSLIASFEAMLLNPRLARSTLLSLAAHQATGDDAWRDAEPGKILHELRLGELAGAGVVPHSPYYGTVDATPLFLILTGEYLRWTGDTETVAALRPAIGAALDWMEGPGDADGDGFLEYSRRSPGGLLNQGWKDSEDCIVDQTGRLAEGPIALAEVQGYAYAARQEAASVLDSLGEPDRARALRSDAERLRAAFDQAFWDDELGAYVLALDGDKRPVRSVTSNAGHCLFSGIADERRAAAVAERLMAPDMFSGWGIRTLSADSPAYNPMSYHNGSVWPHDNALVAAGLRRYGHDTEATRVAEVMFEAAWRDRDRRLQELWCGFERSGDGPPVAYPVACSPQAWAAAAAYQLIRTVLAIEPLAAEGRLTAARSAPAWLGRVEVRGAGVGGAVAHLSIV